MTDCLRNVSTQGEIVSIICALLGHYSIRIAGPCSSLRRVFSISIIQTMQISIQMEISTWSRTCRFCSLTSNPCSHNPRRMMVAVDCEQITTTQLLVIHLTVRTWKDTSTTCSKLPSSYFVGPKALLSGEMMRGKLPGVRSIPTSLSPHFGWCPHVGLRRTNRGFTAHKELDGFYLDLFPIQIDALNLSLGPQTTRPP